MRILCNAIFFIAMHQKRVYKRYTLRSRHIGTQVRCGSHKLGPICRGCVVRADHALRQPKDDSHVLAVPNTYFGGDVSVAGLLTGQDLLKVREQIVGDYVIIPGSIIKSDEPILLDGMRYEDLRSQYPVPIFDLDTQSLINFLSK